MSKSRISLGKAFHKWKDQKELYDKCYHPDVKTSLVLHPELAEGQESMTSKRDRVPASEFMEHLLCLHEQTCKSCNIDRSSESEDETTLSAVDETSEQHSPSLQAAIPATTIQIPGLHYTPVAGHQDVVGTSSQVLQNIVTPRITSGMVPPVVASTPLQQQQEPLCQPIDAPVEIPKQKSKRKHRKKSRRWLRFEDLPTESDSLDIDSESEDSQIDDDEDQDYSLPKGYSLLNISTDAIVFDVEEEEHDDEKSKEEEEETTENFRDIPKIVSGKENENLAEEAADAIVSDKKFITFSSQILPLLKQVYGENCKRDNCKKSLEYNQKHIGTCCKIMISCSAGHSNGIWDSQPTFRRQYVGNFLLASSLLFSGNSFQKISLMFRFMGLNCISSSTFYCIQRLYLAPTVQEYWLEMQREILTNIRLKQPEGAIISSDARMDSPGYSAQYCTSSFMENSTKKIVHLEVVDVREAAGKSTNMEKIGFQRGLSYLDGIIKVHQVVTDAHPQILPLMRTPDLNHIGHQIDIWHGGKSLVKRLTKVAAPSATKALQPWIPAVRSHFWHVARECGGDVTRMKAMWLGLLHHTVNEHKWPMMSDGYPGCCDHGPIDKEERNKAWLTKGSRAHQALTAIVQEKRFLKMFPYYVNFQHTGTLESFHNHILMYCPKRHSYFFTGYKTRNLLAVIDHNEHVNRPVKKNENDDDKARICSQFNRRSKKWVPVMIREAKQYSYISKLQTQALMKRYRDEKSLKQKVDNPDDPRTIFPNRFMVPKPSEEEMLEEYNKHRRFQVSETSSAL